MSIATIVSMDMSSGSEDAVGTAVAIEDLEDSAAVVVEWRAECS